MKKQLIGRTAALAVIDEEIRAWKESAGELDDREWKDRCRSHVQSLRMVRLKIATLRAEP